VKENTTRHRAASPLFGQLGSGVISNHCQCGSSLAANITLVLNNARIGSQIASFAEYRSD